MVEMLRPFVLVVHLVILCIWALLSSKACGKNKFSLFEESITFPRLPFARIKWTENRFLVVVRLSFPSPPNRGLSF